MGRVEGKVAFISGIARGQGRSHAVRLAEEGADIVGFDVCADNPSVEYPLATEADLEETRLLVEKTGRRIIAKVADVRDFAAVKAIADEGFGEFGRIDIVLANAGIMPITGPQSHENAAWGAAIDVMLTGVFNTLQATVPHVRAGKQGGAIVITSSTAGLIGGKFEPNAGTLGYIAAKHGVVGLMRSYANNLASESIRVNTVHPTGVASPMILNEAFGKFVQEYPTIAENLQNPLPIGEMGMLTPEDVTEQVLHLVSDTGRYITGTTFVVDAGFTMK